MPVGEKQSLLGDIFGVDFILDDFHGDGKNEVALRRAHVGAEFQ
jgi:hypothetical protein